MAPISINDEQERQIVKIKPRVTKMKTETNWRIKYSNNFSKNILDSTNKLKR